jgi:hypothetical protein
MPHDQLSDDVERLLAGFRPAAPGRRLDAAIAGRVAPRQTGWRRAAALGAASALAAVACFALFLAEGPADPPEAHRAAASLGTLREEVALLCIGDLRDELGQMREMLELVPRRKGGARLKISAKIAECLRRLDRVENRVRSKPGHSYVSDPEGQEVQV